MQPRVKAVVYLVLAATFWSTSGVLIKSIDWTPVGIASIRGLLAAVTIGILVPGGFRPRLLTKGHIVAAVCLAILSMLFVTAMTMAPAANVTVLQYTAPLWVAVLAPLLLRERTSGRDWFFMSLIFAGVVLFFFDGISMEGFWGNILAVISGIFFGAQAVFLRGVSDKSPVQAIILGNFLAFVIGIPFFVGSFPDALSCVYLVILGVVQMGVAYFLYSLAVPNVTSMELVLIPMLEPIICPIWVVLAIGEIPGPLALTGAAVVILSVIVWSVMKARAAADIINS
ncbi:MAG: DMT family transporter [Deltaproteobacteria bacterium]|jgi:drug/metabolite transporter (DMT)-like permease|nr:DMT family transporter [Deltaproteobacteria bacterium]